jgi:hypothetical protein
MDIAQIHNWQDLYKHFHHECHRSEKAFRISIQDLGEEDRITLCTALGWTYVRREWSNTMQYMYWKLALKSLDNKPPPVQEEPVVEVVTKPRLFPQFFVKDDKYASLYPPMDDATYEKTKQSVREHGFINPVTVGDLGELYDGYHRTRIWEELRAEGLTLEMPYVVKNFKTEEEIFEYLRIKNEYRRHLDIYERTQAAIKLLPKIQRDLQLEGHKSRAETRKGNKERQSGKRSATDIAGEKFGVSGRTIRRALTIEQSNHQDIKEAVGRGQMTVNKGYEEIRKRDGKKRKSNDNGKANIEATQPAAYLELDPQPSPDQLYSQVGRTANLSSEIHDADAEPAPAITTSGANMYISALRYAKAGFIRILIEVYGSNTNRKERMKPHENEYLLWLDQFINGGKYIYGTTQ